jgi:hypothetical protein
MKFNTTITTRGITMHPHTDHVSLTNRDGTHHAHPLPILRLGPDGASRDITADDLQPVDDEQPVPAWVWALCGLVIGLLIAWL